ncbi:hypothetical protein KDM87_13975 [Undibacterium sp. FT147W]|uniref:Uncharacterized protein n=1 Tax=Undibacterium rivi TaxID=2828729 RepID=A0ABS5H4D5_9BURK|nr:hypothetical protein [Undibacterium rivi]MBR7793702.1 hypothetical protein [Undibacterium rivi]
MNLILERTDQVRFFTNMRLVFAALGVSAADFDWFVSDIETNYYGTDFTSDDQWIDGEALQNFIDQNEVQFIWAVFSAVPKGFRTVVTKIPYIEGNQEYWNGRERHPQLPGALFEISCWDSSATILVGLSPELEKNFKRAYSDARSLVSVAR